MINLLRKYIQKIANRFGYTIINNNQRIVELSDSDKSEESKSSSDSESIGSLD